MKLVVAILLALAVASCAGEDKKASPTCEHVEAKLADAQAAEKDARASLSEYVKSVETLTTEKSKLEAALKEAQSSANGQATQLEAELKAWKSKAEENQSRADLASAHSEGLKEELERINKELGEAKLKAEDSVKDKNSVQQKASEAEKKYHEVLSRLQEAELQRDRATESAKKVEKDLKSLKQQSADAISRAEKLEAAEKAREEDIMAVLGTVGKYLKLKFSEANVWAKENLNSVVLKEKYSEAYTFAETHTRTARAWLDENSKPLQAGAKDRYAAFQRWSAKVIVEGEKAFAIATKRVDAFLSEDENGRKVKAFGLDAKEKVEHSVEVVQQAILEHFPEKVHPSIDPHRKDIVFYSTWGLLFAPFVYLFMWVPLRWFLRLLCCASAPAKSGGKSTRK